MHIEIIAHPEEETLTSMGIRSWPIWEKEESQFPWHYDAQETCYILEGEVTVKTEYEEVTFGGGDMVIFPAGLDCEWIIHKAVKKHYNFD